VLEAAQDPERWREAREQLFSLWLKGAPAAVVDEVRREMGAYDFDIWSPAGRAIAADYARYGSPLRALAEIDPKPNVLHVFSNRAIPRSSPRRRGSRLRTAGSRSSASAG
jgi:hypothetical protein